MGTAVRDEGCAALLCESKLIAQLIELLKVHQEDDEIVLQILYVFQVVLCHEETADYLIDDTGWLHSNFIKK